MVSGAACETTALRARAFAAAATVTDPELPALTIADLGILRGVEIAADGMVDIVITPTYSACPAMTVIAMEIGRALDEAGICRHRVRQVLSPAWTTDWLSAAARAKLAAEGIAPPGPRAGGLFAAARIPCPRCGAAETEQIAAFGATACKSLWRCTRCREPFDHFKCH